MTSQATLSHDDVVQTIGRARLLPVIRVATAHQALEIAERLCAAGLAAVELTATTPGWPDAIASLRQRYPQLLVGAGTITTEADARTALGSGAHFLVSPYPAPAVRPVAAAQDLPFIEGGFTPAELADAAGRGVAKMFPAHVGGLEMLKSMLAVLPGARIIPTGGIRLSEVRQWLQAGAFAVGVGSDLTAPGDIAERVQHALGAAA